MPIVLCFFVIKKFARVRLSSPDFERVHQSSTDSADVRVVSRSRTNDRLTAFCDDLPFVNFASFCSKIFSSVLRSSCHREIWCHSLIKFDRLRPFAVKHRLLVIVFPSFWRVRVRRSSIDFESHHSSQASRACRSGRAFMRRKWTRSRDRFDFLNCLLTTLSKRLSRRFGAVRSNRWLRGRSVINLFQDVKDQLSTSGCGFEKPGEPGRNGQKVVLRKW